MPQGGGEDDEEETDGEDLDVTVSFSSKTKGEFWCAHEGEGDDGLEACCHDEGGVRSRLQDSGLSGVQQGPGLFPTPKVKSC